VANNEFLGKLSLLLDEAYATLKRANEGMTELETRRQKIQLYIGRMEAQRDIVVLCEATIRAEDFSQLLIRPNDIN
jgi:hypothetical protein